jgi:hypothetical protein
VSDLILMSGPVIVFIYFAFHPDQIAIIGQLLESMWG